jgi:hypothetical protein
MQTSTYSIIRDPDGAPHEIVGLTWVLALVAAIASFAALAFGGAFAAIGIGLVPAAIVALDRRARGRRARRRA